MPSVIKEPPLDEEEGLICDIASIIQSLPKNNSIMGRECFSQEVAYFLIGMGMEKYVNTFREEEISLEMLLALKDSDLLKMGISDEGDRTKIIANISLKRPHAPSQTINEVAVPPNAAEDLVIAKNLLIHTNLLDANLQVMLVKMKKTKLRDYYVSRDDSGLSLLKIVADKAAQQCNIICQKLYQPKTKTGVIYQILQEEKMTLPPHLNKKLAGGRKIKKNVTYLIVAAGVCSLSALLYRILR